jgi:hypothetical protein
VPHFAEDPVLSQPFGVIAATGSTRYVGRTARDGFFRRDLFHHQHGRKELADLGGVLGKPRAVFADLGPLAAAVGSRTARRAAGLSRD